MSNTYPGFCLVCGKHVGAGQGHWQRWRGKHRVRCRDCVGLGNTPRPPVKLRLTIKKKGLTTNKQSDKL